LPVVVVVVKLILSIAPNVVPISYPQNLLFKSYSSLLGPWSDASAVSFLISFLQLKTKTRKAFPLEPHWIEVCSHTTALLIVLEMNYILWKVRPTEDLAATIMQKYVYNHDWHVSTPTVLIALLLW